VFTAKEEFERRIGKDVEKNLNKAYTLPVSPAPPPQILPAPTIQVALSGRVIIINGGSAGLSRAAEFRAAVSNPSNSSNTSSNTSKGVARLTDKISRTVVPGHPAPVPGGTAARV
jgi:hypothetical protein